MSKHPGKIAAGAGQTPYFYREPGVEPLSGLSAG
jgi:hypothetical protein